MFKIIGLLGVLAITFAYFYAQYEPKFNNTKNYYILNGIGSFFIILSLIFDAFNLSAFCIETMWLLISIYGYFKNYKRNKNA